MKRDDVIRIARKAGIAKYGLGWTCWEGQLERFAALVAAAEREACAKLFDGAVWSYDYREIAVAIRARGEK